jgi:uncharacterized membrane protein (DUF2068 family)
MIVPPDRKVKKWQNLRKGTFLPVVSATIYLKICRLEYLHRIVESAVGAYLCGSNKEDFHEGV